MQIREFIEESTKTAVYPGQESVDGLGYTVFGLCGEVGECFEISKKIVRDDASVLTKEKKERYLKEIGDVCWYLSQILVECGVNLSSFEVETKDFQESVVEQVVPHSGIPGVNANLVIIHNTTDKILTSFARFSTIIEDEGEIEIILLDIVKDVIRIFERIACAANCLDTELESIFQGNLDKLTARMDAGKIKGDGEDLDER